MQPKALFAAAGAREVARAPGPTEAGGPQNATNFPRRRNATTFPRKGIIAPRFRVAAFWSRLGDSFEPSDRRRRSARRPLEQKCVISMGQNVVPKRTPDAGRAARPETRFDPAGSTGGPCTTGPGAPTGTPKRRRNYFENWGPAAAKCPPAGGDNAPHRWPPVAAVEDRSGNRMSPG